MTNLDQAKTLHIGKGDMKSVTYVATTNEINIEEYLDMSPRNWIPRGRWKPLVASEDSEESIYCYNQSQEGGKLCVNTGEKCEKLLSQAVINDYSRSGCSQGDKGNNRC